MAILVCFLVFLVAVSFHSFSSLATEKVYIVHVNADNKPARYATHFDWYSDQFIRPDGVLHVYDNVYHGFSASMTPERAEDLSLHADVLDISEDQVHHLHTTRSPEFIGLSKTNRLWPNTSYGSNMIIGIFDGGIWPEHPSFSDKHLGPVPSSSRWRGKCEIGQEFNESHCNRKLIGARFFTNGYNETFKGNYSNRFLEYLSPRDAVGHGTHVASTAAGCFVEGASLNGSTVISGVAKGVAPMARLAVYKVCWLNTCVASDILAAYNLAIHDGVDVISSSMGALGEQSYMSDINAIASFGAISRGISVVMSAGNFGPKFATLENNAPWQFVVGAASIDRDYRSLVVLGNEGNLTGVSLSSDQSIHNKLLPLVFPGITDPSSPRSKCLEGYLNAAMVKDKIVVCMRGDGERLEKGIVVKQLGAKAMIIINNVVDGEELIPEDHVLPTLALGFRAGQLVLNYVKSTATATGRLQFMKAELGVKPAPIVCSFSSRGPTFLSPQILKPDVVAPGLGILAAWTDHLSITGFDEDRRHTSFNIMTGTSMSCPHVSGAVALMKARWPTWSHDAIRSALMTTANAYDNQNHFVGDKATDGGAASPFALGSGSINLTAAMDPGLVYDIIPSDYVSFLCSLYHGSQVRKYFGHHLNCLVKQSPENLNYPSFTAVFNSSEFTNQTVQKKFTRTVTNVGPSESVYSANIVNPKGAIVKVDTSVLVFKKATTKKTFVLTVILDTTIPISGDFTHVYGSLTWFDGRHTVRSPIVVLVVS